MIVVLLFCLCYILGLRKEEIAPLLYKDIDIENKLITVDKAVHWEKNKPFVKSTKNEDTRKLPILDIIYDKVKELKNNHKDSDIFIPAVKNKQIMSKTAIRRLLEHTLNQINKQYTKDQLDTLKSVSENEEDIKEEDIKIIKFTYHQLRHTYTCILHKARCSCQRSTVPYRT